jgi:sugar phosphate isomerase/epimerase
MKIALHSVSYSGAWEGQHILSLKDFICKAANLGYDGVEILAKRPHASPLDLKEEDCKYLRKFAESKKIEISCIAGYHDFSHDILHIDMAHKEKELVYLEAELKLANWLGAPIVRTYGGFIHSNVNWDEQWKWVIDGLNEGAKLAEKYGVILGLQNHSEIGCHHEDILDIIKEVESKNLKVILDASYVTITGEPIPKVVHQMGNLIVHSHLSDHIFRPLIRWSQPASPQMTLGPYKVNRWWGVPVGEGDIDYKTFVRALMEIGYQGFLSYEICGPLKGGGFEENLDKTAKKTLNYIRSLIADLEKEMKVIK